MDFTAWIQSVDRQLASDKVSVRCRGLDPAALKDAFTSGISPVIFAKARPLPIKQRVRQPKIRRFGWLPWAGVALLAAGGYRLVRNIILERAGEEVISRIRVVPIALPVKTEYGPYLPAEHSKAISLAEDFVRPMLLQPSSATFSEETATEYTPPHTFKIDGYVDAVNDFGTKVRANWIVLVDADDKKPECTAIMLESTGKSDIWNAAPVNPKKPGLKVDPSIRHRRTDVPLGER